MLYKAVPIYCPVLEGPPPAPAGILRKRYRSKKVLGSKLLKEMTFPLPEPAETVAEPYKTCWKCIFIKLCSNVYWGVKKPGGELDPRMFKTLIKQRGSAKPKTRKSVLYMHGNAPQRGPGTYVNLFRKLKENSTHRYLFSFKSFEPSTFPRPPPPPSLPRGGCF